MIHPGFIAHATVKEAMLSKAAASAGLFSLGDVLAQRLSRGSPIAAAVPPGPSSVDERNPRAFDWRRHASFVTFGGLVYAPTQQVWFAWMERNVAVTWTSAPLRQAAARVCLHSVVYAPFSIAALLAWMGLARTGEVSSACDLLTPRAIFPIWLTGSVFWIPTMLAVYRFVPLNQRVVVTAAANVLWSGYLSRQSSVEKEPSS